MKKHYIVLNIALTIGFLGGVFGFAAVANAESSITFPQLPPLVFCPDGHGGHVQHAPCPVRGRVAGTRHLRMGATE